MPTMPKAPSTRSQRSFEDTLIVTSSSGESCTLAELCMCTDYSSCPIAIPLCSESTVRISGRSFSNGSEGLRCLLCKRKRPYRFTSLNIA